MPVPTNRENRKRRKLFVAPTWIWTVRGTPVYRESSGEVTANTKSEARAAIKIQLGISPHGRLPVGTHLSKATK